MNVVIIIIKFAEFSPTTTVKFLSGEFLMNEIVPFQSIDVVVVGLMRRTSFW